MKVKRFHLTVQSGSGQRIFLLLVPFMMVCLIHCTHPVDSDFGGQNIGLADDELFWVTELRPPRKRKKSRKHSISLSPEMAGNKAFFDQLLPKVVRDLFAGRLKGYQDYEFVEEEKEIGNPEAVLASLGGDPNQLDALFQKVELKTRIYSNDGKYRAFPIFLKLIWKDTNGKGPEKAFANIKVTDLLKENYAMKIKGKTLSFLAFFQSGQYEFQPVYLKNNQLEYRVRSSREATYLKKMVLSGNWDQISWLESGLNTSGLNPIPMSAAETDRFSGSYVRIKEAALPIENKASGIGDSAKTDLKLRDTEVFLTAEKGYLIADWHDKFQLEKVFPFSESSFFSLSGDRYFFRKEDSLGLQLLVTIGTDSLKLKRVPLQTQ